MLTADVLHIDGRSRAGPRGLRPLLNLRLSIGIQLQKQNHLSLATQVVSLTSVASFSPVAVIVYTYLYLDHLDVA